VLNKIWTTLLINGLRPYYPTFILSAEKIDEQNVGGMKVLLHSTI
jgi:hypothetical protein